MVLISSSKVGFPGNRTPDSYLGTAPSTQRLHFPSSLATRSGHVTRFGPMKCQWKCMTLPRCQPKSLLKKLKSLHFKVGLAAGSVWIWWVD